MDAQAFCFWLQGYFEIREAAPQPSLGMTAEQVRIVRDHLALVFQHAAGGREAESLPLEQAVREDLGEAPGKVPSDPLGILKPRLGWQGSATPKTRSPTSRSSARNSGLAQDRRFPGEIKGR